MFLRRMSYSPHASLYSGVYIGTGRLSGLPAVNQLSFPTRNINNTLSGFRLRKPTIRVICGGVTGPKARQKIPWCRKTWWELRVSLKNLENMSRAKVLNFEPQVKHITNPHLRRYSKSWNVVMAWKVKARVNWCLWFYGSFSWNHLVFFTDYFSRVDFFPNVICFNLNLINRKEHARKPKSPVLSKEKVKQMDVS